jgi:glycosyltransferase involved in cell wall biosynthesis
MLKGEEGNQWSDLVELTDWLQDVRPDIIHISNGLLLGLAGRIKEKVGSALVCSLQDEDSWIDALAPEEAAEAWRLMASRSDDIDLFLPVSEYYADKMGTRLGIPKERMEVIPVGVEPGSAGPVPLEPPVIGFLSHMTQNMGLDILVDAYLLLIRRSEFRNLRLALCGGQTATDHRHVSGLLSVVEKEGGKVDIYPLEKRTEMLQSLTLLSVPVPGGEAFGTFQIEAMARGVPVVQPAEGGFPEVIRATGGGVLYEPNTPEHLAVAIESLLADPEKLRGIARAGRESVLANYTLDTMTKRIEAAYGRYV